jgi:hypothetical protein
MSWTLLCRETPHFQWVCTTHSSKEHLHSFSCGLSFNLLMSKNQTARRTTTFHSAARLIAVTTIMIHYPEVAPPISHARNRCHLIQKIPTPEYCVLIIIWPRIFSGLRHAGRSISIVNRIGGLTLDCINRKEMRVCSFHQSDRQNWHIHLLSVVI